MPTARYQRPSVSTHSFNHNPIHKIFSQEISSLDSFHMEPVIALRSHKTNNEATFQFENTDNDGEDIYGWWFKPTPTTLAAYPRLTGYRIHIIND